MPPHRPTDYRIRLQAMPRTPRQDAFGPLPFDCRAGRSRILTIDASALMRPASSQGLLEPPPGNASNASSSRARSQMVRLLIRLGWGILPSFTIASNRLGETPTYAAASDRDNPRGGSDSGSIEVGRCATWRVTSFGSRNKRAQGPDCSEAYSASLMQIGASSRPFLSRCLCCTGR